MSKTTEMLEAVQAAIIDITVNGEEVQIGNRRYRMSNIKHLYEVEQNLLSRLALETRTSIRVPVRFNA
jgi:SHS2 domain-containing protein